MKFIPFNCRWIMTPLIWIDTKKWILQNSHFTLPSRNIAAVFKGSNGFDYFNIFDYFMKDGITTGTFEMF